MTEKKTEETTQELVPAVQDKKTIMASNRGLQLRTFDDMQRFANCVVGSTLAPKSFKTSAQVVIAIQSGAELGMTPMRALGSFCVINGAARLHTDAPLALVRQSGLMEYIKETIEGTGDEMVAVCVTKRKGDPEQMRTEFSVEDAKTANLWKKSGTWQSHPKRMLKYKARSFNLRDNFPDCLGGATIAEEYSDTAPEAAYETTTPKRAKRVKPLEDVTITDKDDQSQKPEANGGTEAAPSGEVDDATKRAMLEGVLNTFENLLPVGYNEKRAAAMFEQYVGYTLGSSIEAEALKAHEITSLAKGLENGLPEPIAEMLPKEPEQKQEPKMTEAEFEEHAKEILPTPEELKEQGKAEEKYLCEGCSIRFGDDPKRAEGICPECLSNEFVKPLEEE